MFVLVRIRSYWLPDTITILYSLLNPQASRLGCVATCTRPSRRSSIRLWKISPAHAHGPEPPMRPRHCHRFQRICQRYRGASQYSTIFTRLKRSLGESLVLLNSTSDASVEVHKIMSTTIYRVEHCNHDHLFITSIFGSIRTSNDIRSGSSTPSLSFRSPYPLSQSPTLLDFIDVASSGVACGLTCVESYRS